MGLCLTGPSLRALDELGLSDACLAEGYGMSTITHLAVNGEPAGEVQLPGLIGARRPATVGIARPVLHRILCAEAERCGVVVRQRATVAAVDQEGALVRVRLSDGSVRRSRCWWARTLSSAFRSRLGLSPMSYVRNRRLDRIREDILTSTDPVGTIAYRWGVSHLGRFAGDCRARFAELPSDTAARR
ncbi:helix-turn-helix domain-containing protein [Streptomyces sp. HUAS TT7]|uniref:helix-turn-helix transcriptional regulator n=1 Tax=Streptomyces sp. HUAS TT7 TaxID=3447507 RepID=UPI003F6561E7